MLFIAELEALKVPSELWEGIANILEDGKFSRISSHSEGPEVDIPNIAYLYIYVRVQ